MIPLIAEKRDEIVALCRRYGIRKLEVFGSAATGAFDPATSDVDLLVDLGEYDAFVADRYLDLASDLEALFNRRVDLITEVSIRNPYLRASIDSQRETVFEERDRQAAA